MSGIPTTGLSRAGCVVGPAGGVTCVVGGQVGHAGHLGGGQTASSAVVGNSERLRMIRIMRKKRTKIRRSAARRFRPKPPRVRPLNIFGLGASMSRGRGVVVEYLGSVAWRLLSTISCCLVPQAAPKISENEKFMKETVSSEGDYREVCAGMHCHGQLP